MKNYTAIILLLLISLTGFSQEEGVDINQLIKETQIGSGDPKDIELIWWIPVEFWEAVFENEKTVTEEQKNSIIEVLKPYAIFAVVDGKIGPLGGVEYTPVDSIESSIKLIDNKSKKHDPIKMKDLNADTQVLLNTMKPMLVNMLGELGRNMHFFVFSDVDKKNNRIADPNTEGEVKLTFLSDEFVWTTPLSAVLSSKQCPVDGAKMSGAWKFCPWHGAELVEPTK